MGETIGIIVDGQGDFAALSCRFKGRYRLVKTDGPRGHSPKPQQIATFSRKQVSMLQALGCTRAIVLLDFEGRTGSWISFLDSLTRQFASISLRIPVAVAVPNRMIENWYLADIAHLSTRKAFLKSGLKQKQYEGKHGKNELKKCFKKNLSYSEVRHGPELFRSVRFAPARKNSSSLDLFLGLL